MTDRNITERLNYRKLRKEGLCTKCWQEFDNPNKQYSKCPSCALKQQYFSRRHYMRNKQEYLDRQKNTRRIRKENNMCSHCGISIREEWGNITKCPNCM